MFGGLFTWLWMEAFAAGGPLPPQLAGLIASIAGMLIGSYWPLRRGRAHPAGHAPGAPAGGHSAGHPGAQPVAQPRHPGAH